MKKKSGRNTSGTQPNAEPRLNPALAQMDEARINSGLQPLPRPLKRMTAFGDAMPVRGGTTGHSDTERLSKTLFGGK
jgi:hypothetical protein